MREDYLSYSIRVGLLALAAGLFEYLGHQFESYGPLPELWLYVATLGPSITSVQTPRRDMLNFLVQRGLSINELMVSGVSGIPYADSPLALIIKAKGLFDQDENPEK